MPRKGRRSQAAKARWSRPDPEQQTVPMSPTSPMSVAESGSSTQPTCSPSPVNNTLGSSLPGAWLWRSADARADFRARRGTGYRHRVQAWPVSPFTGHQHKLVIPPESPDKKFVLIVGDSHLRAIVDGKVQMPEEPFSFGVMSTPGAAASALRTEVLHATVPRIPDAICLLAPSNNLTASRTIDEAAVDYAKLLLAIRSRWPNVFVVDFPPRLNCEVSYQTLLRQEFHRVSARMGVKYFSAEESFPLNRTKLWSRDGVHLSDDEGMGILVSLLLSATKQQLDPSPAPRTSPRLLPRPWKVPPKKVVKGEVRAPRQPAPKRQHPCYVRKTSHHGKPSRSQGSPKPRMAQPQAEESFLPLNPVWFSSAALQAMEEVSPSHLSCTVDDKPSPKHKGVASSASARRPRVTARPPRRHRSSVNKLVGSPPTRVSWSSDEEAPLSPISLPQRTVSPVRPPCTEETQPRSPVNNLVGSPPARCSLSSGDAATPCCSPAAKIAKLQTPSPTTPSWIIPDAGCSPRSPAKKPKTPTPPSTAWPWLISDAPSTSWSPANEWMMSLLTVKMQIKLLVQPPPSQRTMTADREGRPPEDRS